MKGIGALAAIVLAVTMVACGGSSSSMNTTDGTWSETLSRSTGQPLGSFTFTVTQNDAALTGSDMDFTNMESLAQCFRTGTVMNGLIQAAGNDEWQHLDNDYVVDCAPSVRLF
jgi:hypothetical protein